MNALAARIESGFHRHRVSPYIVLGYPTLDRSVAYIDAACQAEVAWIEVGLPYSDPSADGPVIQEATSTALHAGFRLKETQDALTPIREAHPDMPLVAMTYANLGFHMGWEPFGAWLAACGFAGVILPDVSLEESEEVRAGLQQAGVAWIPLVTPATSADRMRAIAQTATGFLYVVSSFGSTGQKEMGPEVERVVRVARSCTHLPVAVGFGIQNRDAVQRVFAAGADVAIIGSALVQRIADGIDPEAFEDLLRSLQS